MAFRRYAKALIERRGVPFEEWMDTLRSQHEGAVPKDYVGRIAKTILRKCSPDQYLLSHATIVASVDTYAPANVRTGRLMNNGMQIDARWPDFRIKQECFDIINNNGDAWSRPLLLNTYRTFVGASNYLEHIQLPALSKGFIVDAIARDLGKSVYVDILVATDRKHQKLVQDILSGSITGLSMGCVSLFTICTKCGNVATDDSNLCPCVLYDGKGTKFADENGIEQPIAELVGHVSIPNSNQFIEASWVKNPAFRGAVRRNFLNADSSHLAAQIDESSVIYELRSQQLIPDGMKKAAAIRLGQAGQDQDVDLGDLGGQDEDQGGQGSQDQGQGQGGQAPAQSEPKTNSVDKLVEKAQEQILEILVKALGEKLAPKPEDVETITVGNRDLTEPSENLVRSSEEFNRRLHLKFRNSPKLVKWASKTYSDVHKGGLKVIKANSLTSQDLILLSWIEDQVFGRKHSSNLYKIAMGAGALNKYPNPDSYLAACQLRLGRSLTDSDRRFLLWKGRIGSVANS